MTARELDRDLEIRERLVVALDELEADDANSARHFLEGLLLDLDVAVAEAAP